MPIYEYECQSCGQVLDALQKISDEPLTHCPSCGEAALKKLLSAPRFRLKGSGWYETDFKDRNRRNVATPDAEPAGKEKGGKDKPGEAKEGKSAKDAKPEKKADTGGKAASGSGSSGSD